MDIRWRIKELLKIKKISKRQFYKEIGVSNGFLDKEGAIGSDKMEQICYTFPNINLNWLLTGKGPMFIEEGSGSGSNIISGIKKEGPATS